jgi:hypothetical protein
MRPARLDRGGWSPPLFAHMDAAGHDVLTWRKVPATNGYPDLFTDLTFVDKGRARAPGVDRGHHRRPPC